MSSHACGADPAGRADVPRDPGRDQNGVMVALLLAHQGGWDEIVLVAGPIVVIAGLLALANKRAKAVLAASSEDSGEDGSASSP